MNDSLRHEIEMIEAVKSIPGYLLDLLGNDRLVGQLENQAFPMPDYIQFAEAWPYPAERIRAAHEWLSAHPRSAESVAP